MKRTALVLLALALLIAATLLIHQEPHRTSPRKPPLREPVVEALPAEPEPVAVAPPAQPPPRPRPVPPTLRPPDPPPPPTGPGTAILRGTVKVLGEPPARKRIRMTADPECMEKHSGDALSDRLVVDRNGGVRWAFVYIAHGINNQPPKGPLAPVLLDQVKCVFEPHVFGIQVGQPLNIYNTDGFLHNAHNTGFLNREFNFGLVDEKLCKTVTFEQPEVMCSIRCEIHPWMVAWVGVLDHPYFSVSSATGSYGIPQLPAGRFTVQIWHEAYQTVAREVDVPAGGDIVLDFILDARKQ